MVISTWASPEGFPIWYFSMRRSIFQILCLVLCMPKGESGNFSQGQAKTPTLSLGPHRGKWTLVYYSRTWWGGRVTSDLWYLYDLQSAQFLIPLEHCFTLSSLFSQQSSGAGRTTIIRTALQKILHLTLSSCLCNSKDFPNMSYFFLFSLVKSSQRCLSSAHLGLMESAA